MRELMGDELLSDNAMDGLIRELYDSADAYCRKQQKICKKLINKIRELEQELDNAYDTPYHK